jgi:hypothetical protein
MDTEAKILAEIDRLKQVEVAYGLLQAERKWIPVRMRLPDSDRNVLVAGGVAYCSDSTWYTMMGDDAHRPIVWEVVEWMELPLPSPPLEVDET